jgi:SET domain-containing protein
MKKMLTKDDVRVGRSYAGLGLFAKKDIPKGASIEYVGEVLPASVADALRSPRYLFEVNKKWTINGATRENLARYINHSCAPNCESDVKGKRVFITTLRMIRAGEELCYDYGEEYVAEYITPHGCKCPKCRKKEEEKGGEKGE